MKFKDLAYLALILILPACGQRNVTESSSDNGDSGKWVRDTAKVNALHELKSSMMAEIMNLIQTGQSNPTVEEGTNKFECQNLNNGRMAIKAIFSSGDSEIRSEFYMVNGKLAYVEFKDFHKIDQPFAKEIYLYLDNGKMFYAEERSISLSPGQGPAAIQSVPRIASTRSSEELMTDITPYFEQAKKAVEPYMSH